MRRRSGRARRGWWPLLQGLVVLGLLALTLGVAAWNHGDEDHPVRPPRQTIQPANLEEELRHNLELCREKINAGGRIEDC